MIIVRIGLGITTVEGSYAQNDTSETVAHGDAASRHSRHISSKSAFQRIRLQFAPPSDVLTPSMPDAELSDLGLNLGETRTRSSEAVPGSKLKEGPQLVGRQRRSGFLLVSERYCRKKPW